MVDMVNIGDGSMQANYSMLDSHVDNGSFAIPTVTIHVILATIY